MENQSIQQSQLDITESVKDFVIQFGVKATIQQLMKANYPIETIHKLLETVGYSTKIEVIKLISKLEQ